MKNDYFIPIYFWIVLLLMIFTPIILSIEINIWTQLFTYIGGFLLGIQFIGESRIISADKNLSKNAKSNTIKLNQLLLSILLLDNENKKLKIKVGLWYIFSLINFIAWYLILDEFPYSLKQFNVLTKNFLISFSIAFLYISLIMLVILTYQKFKIKVFYILFYIIWTPLAIVGAWITIPWLLFVIITWAILQLLLLIVHLKNKLSLGNVFYVLGFILLIISFILFLVEQFTKKID